MARLAAASDIVSRQSGHTAPIMLATLDRGWEADDTFLDEAIDGLYSLPWISPGALDQIGSETPTAATIAPKPQSDARVALVHEMLVTEAAVDQFSEVARADLDMPVDGTLDQMRRPDQRVEGDISFSHDMDHAAMMAFLEEPVIINIAESDKEGDENPVPLYVNGRAVAVLRGQDTWVKRKYVELLLRAKPESLKTYVPDRPGHDRRYLLNSAKIRRELGWEPEVGFDEGMRITVDWYETHQDWWRPLKERLAIQEGAWGN